MNVYHFDVEEVKSLIMLERPKLVVVNFPHNPTGATLSPAQMNDLVQACREAGCFLFCDEMYRGLEHEGVPTIPPVATLYDKAISLGGVSKSLGLPSANIFAVSPNGELAIGLDPQLTLWSWGRLATIPLMGGAPRELAGNVEGADWSADGQTLVVTNPFGETGNLESPPGTPIIELPGRLTHPRISPDGQWIAVCHNPNPGDTRGEIMIVDWEGNPP